MKKGKINISIDALLLVCLAGLAGTGFLNAFRLLPGYGQVAKYGRLVNLTFLGMNRHTWGNIHLWLGYVFMGLMVLHVIFHWKLILGMWAKLIGLRGPRRLATFTLLLVCVALVATPFVAPPTVGEVSLARRGRGAALAGGTPETAPEFDRGGYGRPSPEERAAYWMERRQGGPRAAGGFRGERRPNFDESHLVKPDGVRGGPHRLPEHVLARYDRDGDGELDETEQAAAQAGKARRVEMLTARFDKGGDGKLNADESAAAWAWVEEDKRVTFQQSDKDGDGNLDEAERSAIRDRSVDRGKPGLPIDTAIER